MAEDRDLGLFPLDLVLLPGESVALHLFEPRYRRLYADCVTDDVPFVLVRGDDDSHERVGCATRFAALTRRHDDGRMDVMVRGERAVEIGSPTGGRPYRSALVRDLHDAGETPPTELRDAVVDRYRVLAGPGVELPAEGGAGLAYALAGTLRLDAAIKQALLAERSEGARLTLLAEVLEGAARDSKRADLAARRAPSNGRVEHS